MTDDELRALERAAREGSPADRLRYARALERAGRRDDAWRALASSLDDPTVRREAARQPCWRRLDGDPGHTWFADVPPLVSSPRVVFRRSVELDAVGGLLASPFGTVVQPFRGDALVLDAAGNVTARLPLAPPAPELLLEGEGLVVVESRRLHVRELATLAPQGGELKLMNERWELDVGLDRERLVIASKLRVSGLAWPRALLNREPVFETWLPPEVQAGIDRRPRVLLAEGVTVVTGPAAYVGLDARGKSVFQGEGRAVMADRDGVVVELGAAQPGTTEVSSLFPSLPWFLRQHDEGRVVAVLDTRGAELWRTGPGLRALALAPDFVVAGTPLDGARFELSILDRRSGAVRATRGAGRGGVVIARDVVTCVDPDETTLVALRSNGDELFRFPLGASRGWLLAPFPRGLLAASVAQRDVLRLEQP